MRRFVFKPRWILGHFLVVAAALTCIRLADWQLSRAHITEAMQNWGYAFQWPLFSVFFLIGWWRMLRLESIRLDEIEAAESLEAAAEVSGGVEDSGAAGVSAAAEVSGVGRTGPPAGAGQAPEPAEAPISKAEARRRARQRPPLTAPILTPASQHSPAGGQPSPTDTGRQPSPTDTDRQAGPADAEDEQLAAYNRMLAKLAAQDAARDEAGRR